LLDIVVEAHREAVRVVLAPTAGEMLARRGRYVPGQAVPLYELRPPAFAGIEWVVKRVFDYSVAVLLILVCAPLLALLALIVKLSSRGPVLFVSRRIGLEEQEFRMFKFRTMYLDAARQQDELESENEADGALFKLRQDPRVTPVGAFLRRFSLDELPQLLNVLRGEMSLVGPRPLPMRDYRRLEPWHRKRYLVLPGMTGLWQVSGRSDLTFDRLVRLDFHYLETWSIWLDISILLRTIPAVVARRGAY
jgi:exopolysaccharide biosynthesis polyprenyl glycosylphosphotransferase